MKIKKACLFILFAFMLIASSITIKVNAVNTGFQTDEISIDRKNSFLSSINISVISEEPPKKDFTCFAVSSDHLIAIAQNTFNSSKQTVCIYSNEGVFQYGYTFDCLGFYELEWDRENLNIYFIRGNFLVSVTPSGEVLDVLKVREKEVENRKYSNEVLGSVKRTVDGTEYSIKNDMGILRICSLSSFSKIIVKDSNGNESIIYDVNSMLFKKAIIILSIFSILVPIAVIGGIRNMKKRKQKIKFIVF